MKCPPEVRLDTVAHVRAATYELETIEYGTPSDGNAFLNAGVQVQVQTKRYHYGALRT